MTSAKLVVKEGHNRGAVLPLTRDPIRIGRDEDCEIRLLDAEASRDHAHVTGLDGTPRLEDRGSRNGVFVNGVPQSEGSDYVVEDGQLLFERPLQKERLGFWRWTAIFLALFGSYRKNDSVDVQYTLNGRTRVATGLDIVAPDGTPSEG